MARNKQIAVIGAGISGMASAALLALDGFEVHLFEKNETHGGRVSTWGRDGFKFDMGPSYFQMPEVFDEFFETFRKKQSDFFESIRLSPPGRIYFGKGDYLDMPDNYAGLESLFEKTEPGSSPALKKFFESAEFKYETGLKNYIFKPSISIWDLMDFKSIKDKFKLQLSEPLSKHIRSSFTNPKLVKLLEYPVLPAGSTPSQSPALYSYYDYLNYNSGVWYPLGGMSKVADSIYRIAVDTGVKFHFRSAVSAIKTDKGIATALVAGGLEMPFDAVISACDYHFTENSLLGEPDRSYDNEFWNQKVMTPGALMFFLGLDKKLSSVQHNNIMISKDIENIDDDFFNPSVKLRDPVFFVSVPTITDASIAPYGKDIVSIMVPIPAGSEDTPKLREEYYKTIMKSFYELTGEDVGKSVILRRMLSINDFATDYNSYKGSLMGFANTLKQTNNQKPKQRSLKVKNLFFAGQTTLPGGSMPMTIISGKNAAAEAVKYLDAKR